MSVHMTIDPSDARFVTGTAQERQLARAEYRRQLRIAIAMRSGLPEIPRSDLSFLKFGLIEDLASGNFYHAVRGELDDPKHSSAVGFYLTASGDPVYLERPAGSPQNRAELEELQAAREQRKNAPKARPAWARR
jgi:hypothetical protein